MAAVLAFVRCPSWNTKTPRASEIISIYIFRLIERAEILTLTGPQAQLVSYPRALKNHMKNMVRSGKQQSNIFTSNFIPFKRTNIEII
jgi:hypothetical protein